MKSVYLFRSDIETIESMQAAALDSASVTGLKITHGLIGTPAWWENIHSGRLKLHTISGVVSNFWPGQWSDGPAEFEIQPQSGEKTIWLCNLEPKQAAKLFNVGRLVELDYVCQELKTPFNGNNLSKLCIAIRVAE